MVKLENPDLVLILFFVLTFQVPVCIIFILVIHMLHQNISSQTSVRARVCVRLARGRRTFFKNLVGYLFSLEQ